MKTKTIFAYSVLSLLLLSGCTSVPRTELQNLPSLVEIMSLNLSEAKLKLRLSHRNQQIREKNQLSCQLAIKDLDTIEFNAIPIPDLTTYAVETIDIDLANKTLPSVDSQNLELPYALDCFLFSENFRKEHLVKKATLYPVPGTFGEYR